MKHDLRCGDMVLLERRDNIKFRSGLNSEWYMLTKDNKSQEEFYISISNPSSRINDLSVSRKIFETSLGKEELPLGPYYIIKDIISAGEYLMRCHASINPNDLNSIVNDRKVSRKIEDLRCRIKDLQNQLSELEGLQDNINRIHRYIKCYDRIYLVPESLYDSVNVGNIVKVDNQENSVQVGKVFESSKPLLNVLGKVVSVLN